MSRLSYDQLDAAYRSLLRQCAQERARADACEKAFLSMRGKLLGLVQWIGDATELLDREHRRTIVGRELDAIASSDVRVTPSLTSGDTPQ